MPDEEQIITNEEIFSSEEQTIDYLTIQGINTRFGLSGKDFDIFILKELLDNALDFIEQNAPDFAKIKQTPYVDVSVTQENPNAVKITVKNSNAGKDAGIFTEEQVNNIFNLREYYSSKRYRHKINRGELGDAFKAMLCIPYAIALNAENENYIYWQYPLEINVSNKRLVKIRVDSIDKIRKRESFEIKNEFKDIGQSKQESNFTEISVYIPKIEVNYDRISDLLKHYVIINTHIDFRYQIPSSENEGVYVYDYIATQNIKYDWKNNLSIYFYSLPDFRDLITSIAKKEPKRIVFDELKKLFREGASLPKDKELENITFEILKSDANKIKNMYITN